MMLFPSLEFFIFLVVAWALFNQAPAYWRWGLLLAASLVFYGAQRPGQLLYLAAVTLLVVAGVAGLSRAAAQPARRAILAGALLLVLGALVALKFYDFAAGEIEAVLGEEVRVPRLGLTAPAGFSFYVFSAASVLIDAYLRRLPAETRALDLALYLSWFPKILAGPIERATPLVQQWRGAWAAEPALVVLGLQLMLWGLLKKVVLADNLAPLVDKAFATPAFSSPLDLLMASYFFAFQIYGDFSGYADIACGVSLLFGLRLMDNFRRPYLSRSTAEFWSARWHISLGNWFRDYLYIPLGGGRAGALRRALNVMVVFLVSGLWHAGLGFGVGWTFVAWGALNGVYHWLGLASRPLWQRCARAWPSVAASRGWAALRVLFTFHLITVAWVFFRARTLDDATLILRRVAEQAHELPALALQYPYSTDQVIGVLLVIGLLSVELVDERRSIFARLAAAPRWLRWSLWYAALALLLLLGRWQLREFIYMQF